MSNQSLSRSIEDVVGELCPNKCNALYDKARPQFKDYCRVNGVTSWDPSTICMVRSNRRAAPCGPRFQSYQVEFGQKLQDVRPRLLLQLKQCNAGYQRKVAQVFTKFEINHFLNVTSERPKGFGFLRKAAAVIAFCADLRVDELKSLKFKDLTETGDGIWVQCTPAKQRGEVKNAQFAIPFDHDNLATCYASRA